MVSGSSGPAAAEGWQGLSSRCQVMQYGALYPARPLSCWRQRFMAVVGLLRDQATGLNWYPSPDGVMLPKAEKKPVIGRCLETVEQ